MNPRVVLADDHGIVLGGVRSSLEQAGCQVIGEVKDGRGAVKLAHEQSPDLVLMDISMPGMNGVEATRRITQELPHVKVLCISMHADPQFVKAALEAGASGYLLKESGLEELHEAIRSVISGQTYLSSGIANRVTPFRPVGFSGALGWGCPTLTSREREILQLIAEGHTNVAIAERLNVSGKTVSAHRQHIMDKLNIHNAVGLTRYAIRHGMTTAEHGSN